MNRPKSRQVLDCASPLALFAKTLSRRCTHLRGSWSQCMRKNERRLSRSAAFRPLQRLQGREAQKAA